MTNLGELLGRQPHPHHIYRAILTALATNSLSNAEIARATSQLGGWDMSQKLMCLQRKRLITCHSKYWLITPAGRRALSDTKEA